MAHNWTQTLTDRAAGRKTGFRLPRDLDKAKKAQLVEIAEARGVDTEDLTVDELRAALQR